MSDQPGTIINGRYELLRRAGTGGMATVWQAMTRGAAGFKRPVAVKRILPSFTADEEFVAMFVEEARVVSALQHPNIVQVHDFGADENGDYYFVMEWVEGIDLHGWTRSHFEFGRRTEWPIVAAIGIEILKALAAAHGRIDDAGRRMPIYHRDVSPANVLIGRNGVVKLSDFGLARAMDRSQMTRAQVVKGKLSYMAPEITHGKRASALSDIFSTSCVLWETLTGHKLFDADDNIEVLRKVRECQGVGQLSAHRPDLPEPVLAAIYRGLAKNPEHRPQSAKEMARNLAQLLRDVDAHAGEEVIAHSVASARQRLGTGTPMPDTSTEWLDESDLEPVESSDPSLEIPLTRLKRK